MKLIAGLGNPGRKYVRTRHNLGFMVLDELASQLGASFTREKYQGLLADTQAEGERLWLVKPQTYMNLSGICVAALARNKVHEMDHILVVVDDIHLPLGKLRFRAGGSAGGHNGLKSLIERLGSKDFHRLRLGVGQAGSGQDLPDHVLSKFRPDEWPEVNEMVERAVQGVLCWITSGIGPAMDRFNRNEQSSGKEDNRA